MKDKATRSRASVRRSSKSRSLSQGVDPREVQDRVQLNKYLSLSASDQYRSFSATGEATQQATFVKSYIVEGHASGDRPTNAQWETVFRNVMPRRDETLVLLEGRDGAFYFVDLSDPRFMILHTIDKAETTDRTIERLTQGSVEGFDRAWLPTDFLFGMRRGLVRGFKFGHQASLSGVVRLEPETQDVYLDGGGVMPTNDEIPVSPIDLSWETIPASKLSISNTLTAERDYRRVKKAGIFEGRQALNSIEFISSDQVGRVVNDLYATGKLVGSGTSVALHLLIVDEVRNIYGRAIRSIEDNIALGWVRSGSAVVHQGEPLTFLFPSGMVTHLENFVSSMFSAVKPFRLFGIQHSATDQRIDVDAIDLHTNDPLAFEITRDWMRVYLPRGSCGNIIARLYANLQHSAHSEVLLRTGTGERLFSEAEARAV